MPYMPYSFKSIKTLADMLDQIETDCEQRAAAYDHNPDIGDKWVNAADAVRQAAKTVREQL